MGIVPSQRLPKAVRWLGRGFENPRRMALTEAKGLLQVTTLSLPDTSAGSKTAAARGRSLHVKGLPAAHSLHFLLGPVPMKAFGEEGEQYTIRGTRPAACLELYLVHIE